jgi:hypothetical protein
MNIDQLTFIRPLLILLFSTAAIGGPFPAIIPVSELDGSNGFKLTGQADDGHGSDYGTQLSSAGDFNADGYMDLFIGTAAANDFSGIAYVIYGSDQPFPANIHLRQITSTQGFSINPDPESGMLGSVVAQLKDINGDGISDLAMGSAQGMMDQSGLVYVVFGLHGGFDQPLSLAELNGDNGFKVYGANAGDLQGTAVNDLNDINGDQLNDLIMGAPGMSQSGRSRGEITVLFSRQDGFNSSYQTNQISDTNGMAILGETLDDFLGVSAWSAGDFNDDGHNDIMTSAIFALNPQNNPGVIYLLYGSEQGFIDRNELINLNSDKGIRVMGEQLGAQTGSVLANLGDINGDHINDLLVGAVRSDHTGQDAGACYVLFGGQVPATETLLLNQLNGANGFKIYGSQAGDGLCRSAATAGDLNHDGVDDFMLGADGAHGTGIVYVVYGQRTGFPAIFDLSSIDGDNGFILQGEATGDHFGFSVAMVGDVNADGADDLLIGTNKNPPPGNLADGASYVIFGVPDVIFSASFEVP